MRHAAEDGVFSSCARAIKITFLVEFPLRLSLSLCWRAVFLLTFLCSALLRSSLLSLLASRLCNPQPSVPMLSLLTILANVAALLLCLALGSAQARPGWGLSRRAAAAEPARPVTGARYAYPVARRQKRQDQPAGDCPPL